MLAFPAAAHKLSKPGSTFSHCAGLKGRLAGDVEKSCVCLNMSLKTEGGGGGGGGGLLNGGQYGSAAHTRHMEE